MTNSTSQVACRGTNQPKGYSKAQPDLTNNLADEEQDGWYWGMGISDFTFVMIESCHAMVCPQSVRR